MELMSPAWMAQLDEIGNECAGFIEGSLRCLINSATATKPARAVKVGELSNFFIQYKTVETAVSFQQLESRPHLSG